MSWITARRRHPAAGYAIVGFVLVLIGLGYAVITSGGAASAASPSAPNAAELAAGAHTFSGSCASCHGEFAQGTSQAPSLIGVGAAAVDFQVGTGRMPAAEQRPVLEFWFRQYPAIPEKTRGNVSISLSAKLARFRHGRMRDCFCGHTDIVPEMILNGAIVIMAMSVLTWNEDGNIGQMIFKYMTQRMIESRNGLPPQYRERPVAIWADEAQYFVSVKDDEFLSTCRASRACVVFLTQTLPAYYARLGKDRTDAVDGIVGKFNTHIFHLNACNRTNTFASQLIGRGIQLRSTSGGSFGTNTSRGMAQGTNTNRGTSKNSGASYGPNSGGWNHGDGSSSGSGDNHGTNVGEGQNEGRSWSAAETMDLLVEPSFFAKELKSGGPANDNIVSALWFKTGGSFGGGANALITRFRQ